MDKILKLLIFLSINTILVNCRSSRPIIQPFSRCVQPGTLAITFDDGPSLTYTNDILDILNEENVKGTFFICGENYSNLNDPLVQEVVLRIQREGHTIASHTWNHPRLTNLTEAEIIWQMNSLSDKIFEITGERPDLFRPPYGRHNSTVLKIVGGQLGYKTIMWSIDTNDWAHPGDTQAGLDEYIKILDGKNPQNTLGFISLHHDPERGSPELVRECVKYVKSLGFRFVSVDECIGF